MGKFYTPYKFEQFDGLPPSGETGLFFGFDADGWTWLLKWNLAQSYFVASGFEPDQQQIRVMHLKDDLADYIVKWAPAPARYSEMLAETA